MPRKIAISLLALAAPFWTPAVLAQGSPHSQPAEGFKYLAAKDVDALTDKPGPGAKTAFPVDHESYYVEYATRSDAGNEAEMHAHWTHYLHVLSGAATLTYGGAIAKARDTGPGQVRGESITGGKSMTVHAGDFIQIPAGMPHMFDPAAGTKFHYVVFNIRQ